MSGAKTDCRNRVVIVRLERVKVAVRISKALFFSYFEKAHLIQLTRLGPLMAWPKIEGYTGVLVDQT